jgi:hypothetical protein
MVLAFGVNKLNPGYPDISVGARSVFLDRRRSERSANGRILLELLNICGEFALWYELQITQLHLQPTRDLSAARKSIASFEMQITPLGAISMQ